MRMKMVCDDRTLRDVANEFLALKKAQKVRERTLSDYKKYIDKFLAQSQNTLDVDVLKIEILECRTVLQQSLNQRNIETVCKQRTCTYKYTCQRVDTPKTPYRT